MPKLQLFILLSLATFLSAHAQVKSPGEFLPHEPGAAFTPHHLLVNYFQHVADQSSSVQLVRYGLTYEQRPLVLAYVSTPENLARLEDIRENNLRRAGLAAGSPDSTLDVAIVWLSFSVHGNEPAGSESAPSVLYELIRPDQTTTREWLKNTIVIIDPSLNPDGYSRYTHWYNGVANTPVDPNPNAAEHREPWPGGRVNHYLFDLNRDWVWQTQVESRSRIAMYLRWLPHIHADIHEQGYTDPYYFAPAAEPYHPYISKWQRDFQVEIGKNHARYFDGQGWLYFTREVFDLFYPSYGDTYPIFSGGIGMTYEQGGGSRGGRAVLLPNGDTLTLKDRVMHHKTTALSTVEIASENADRLVREFTAYFERAQRSPVGKYKTYIISGANAPGKLAAFTKLMDQNGIEYGVADKALELEAYDYQTGQTSDLQTTDQDIFISAYQPRGLLAQVLLDPESEITDSLTYDITAWSLPYAYGLQTYASTQKIAITQPYRLPTDENSAELSAGTLPYAYLIPHQSMQDVSLVAQLLREDVKLRYATMPFTLEGRTYAAGTFLATRADNRKHPKLAEAIQQAVAKHPAQVFTAQTGMVDRGRDLGSDAMVMIERPKVAVLSGEGVSPYGFGQIWHYFEQSLRYPISVFRAESFGRIDLSDHQVLILPEGQYDWDEETIQQLQNWISGGGRLIAIGYALRSLEAHEGFNLTPRAEDSAEEEDDRAEISDLLQDYGGHTRRRISNSISGAIFGVDLDTTHPLAFGLSEVYFSLKTNTINYAPLTDGWNVGTIGEAPLISGFVGAQAKTQLKNTVVFGVQEMGRGSVVYLVDNPLFRGFWENGKMLFSNAVFFRL